MSVVFSKINDVIVDDYYLLIWCNSPVEICIAI